MILTSCPHITLPFHILFNQCHLSVRGQVTSTISSLFAGAKHCMEFVQKDQNIFFLHIKSCSFVRDIHICIAESEALSLSSELAIDPAYLE